MKGKAGILRLSITLICGAIIGWMLAYLKVPYVDDHTQLWIGFAAACAIIFVMLAVRSEIGGVKPSRRFWIIATGLSLVLLLLLANWTQNVVRSNQLTQQNTQLNRQAALLEANRIGASSELLTATISAVERELEQRGDRSLSETMIQRVAATSETLQPYRFLENDSLTEMALSPERGQLLIALVFMDIDSNTWSQLKLQTTFDHADVKGVDFSGRDLSNAQLSKARLEKAILRQADLSHADLRSANLFGADLSDSKAHHTVFEHADLSWTIFDGSDATKASLSGVKVDGAKFRGATLKEAQMQWVVIASCLFVDVNAELASFMGSEVKESSFKGAVLKKANLNMVEFLRSDLTNAHLDSAGVRSEDWMELISAGHTDGVNDLKQKYHVVVDTTDAFNYRIVNIAP